jgi:hypothetical protein
VVALCESAVSGKTISRLGKSRMGLKASDTEFPMHDLPLDIFERPLVRYHMQNGREVT